MIQLAASVVSGCRHWWHSDGCAVMLDFICILSLFMQFVTNSVINVLNEFGENGSCDFSHFVDLL